MKIREAEEIVGKLSEPSKMPGLAWGIPASRCHRGSKLRQVEGTVCSLCYACKGRYAFSPVEQAYERRYQRYVANKRGARWYDAMCTLLSSVRALKVPFFRWFDSGDVQDVGMLWDIVDVCSAVPSMNFWMSTRERSIVTQFLLEGRKPLPPNLVIRVSADMIDTEAPNKWGNTSQVKTCPSLADWHTLTSKNTEGEWHCPAPLNDNECGDCRACWDPAIKVVIYRKH